jgi:hypothetical protein
VNNWGDGDLPAPYAEGDLLWLPEGLDVDGGRMHGMTGPGWFVVCAGFSIDDGDAWYFRVTNNSERNSDRLHVAYLDRCTWDHGCDYMAPFELVDTSDPEGLAKRERLLAEGWTFRPPDVCPTCGSRRPA